MFEDVYGKEYHSAIVDVTDKCNLRCKHCFYYREEHDSQEIDADVFLKGLKLLQQKHNIMSMGWCGGEPLYRTEVVKEGASFFKMNQLFTNGTLPIPDIPDLVPFVSMDGTRELHDYVRGKGVYDRVIENVRQSPTPIVIFLATFHRLNESCVEDMLGELSQIKKTALLAMTFIPLKKYEKVKGYTYTDTQKSKLDFSWDERDRFIDNLLKLKIKYPEYLLNSEVNLQLMKKENALEATKRCNMPKRTLTLDLRLDRKLPCVMGGPEIDCSKCGCPFPYEQEARRRRLKSKTDFPV